MPDGFRRVRDQYAWFRRRFPGDVLFFQVGRFCEFYAPRDSRSAGQLRLRLMQRNHRGARFGFPLPQLDQYVARLRDLRQSLLVVTEQPVEQARVRPRWPLARYVWPCA